MVDAAPQELTTPRRGLLPARRPATVSHVWAPVHVGCTAHRAAVLLPCGGALPAVGRCLLCGAACRAALPVVRRCLSCGAACRAALPVVRRCLSCGAACRAALPAVGFCVAVSLCGGAFLRRALLRAPALVYGGRYSAAATGRVRV